MKKFLYCITVILAAALFASCNEVAHTDTYSDLHDDNATEHFVLHQVIEYDPLNPTGINLFPYFTEFQTLSLVIYYEDGEIKYAEFDNGELPYLPVAFNVPEGKIPITYDSGTYPPVLRLASGEVLAKMIYNEPVFEFSLDYYKISYKYSFKAVKD